MYMNNWFLFRPDSGSVTSWAHANASIGSDEYYVFVEIINLSIFWSLCNKQHISEVADKSLPLITSILITEKEH